MTKISGQF